MARLVIDLGVTMRLLEEDTVWSKAHTVLAPTVLRSHVLEDFYRRVRGNHLPEDVALARNAAFARLKIRYLGDAVLRRRAWRLAKDLGLSSTQDAEYLALTQLQADALVTERADLVAMAKGLVTTVTFRDLLD